MPNAQQVASPVERPVAFTKTQASVLLDLVRGLAALLVLLGHWRNMLFVDYPQLTAHKALWLLPYLLTSAGHQAVVIFFVLSGYLISGSIFRSMERGQWSWSFYATHRLVRLWTVLLPGLVLCAVFDHVGLRLNHAPLLYAGFSGNHLISAVRPMLRPWIFAGNVFFLQTIRTPVFGSDGPLWSLANEFWYYVLFPLGYVMVWRRTGTLGRVLCALGFVVAAWFVGWGILAGFPIWLMGAVLAVVPAPRVGSAARWAAAVAYAPLVFFLAKFRGLSGVLSDDLLGVATFFLLWVMLSATKKARAEAAGVRVSRGLARFSFTLYVAHMPLLLLLASLTVADTRWTPDVRHLGFGLVLLVVLLAFAYGLAWATEFRTDQLRRWVELRLGLVNRTQTLAREATVAQ